MTEVTEMDFIVASITKHRYSGGIMRSYQITSLAWFAALALCSCKESQSHVTPRADKPEEVTHSIVIKFWDKEVFKESKPRPPKVLVDSFDELYSMHIEDDPKWIDIELTYDIKKGDELLYSSYRVFSYANHTPKKPIRFDILKTRDGKNPTMPVKSYEHARSLIHEHSAEVFEEWWQNRDIGDKAS